MLLCAAMRNVASLQHFDMQLLATLRDYVQIEKVD